jgi:hypothetical protein
VGGRPDRGASSKASGALAQHSITVSALGPATLSGGSLTLPIVGGSVRTPSLTGRIVHKGGVKFTGGTRSVTLSDFVLVRGAQTTVLAARTGGKELIVARVTQLTRTTSSGQTVVTGDLKLSAAASRDINRFFGKHVVNAGVDIGTLKSTVTVA